MGSLRTETLRRWAWDTAVPVVFLVLGLAAFSGALPGAFHLDDLHNIRDNPMIRDLRHTADLWWWDPSRYLTHLSFALGTSVHGLNPSGFLTVNILLHVVVSLLVYRWIRLLCELEPRRRRRRGEDRAGRAAALGAGLVFLLHPVQTEAVAYISQRATLLAGFCYFGSLIWYLDYRRSGRGIFFILSVVTAVLGVFTKPIVMSYPLAVYLHEAILLRRTLRVDRALAVRLAPFVLVALFVPCLLVMWKFKGFDPAHLTDVSRETTAVSRWLYLRTEVRVFWTYVRLWLFPLRQTVDYDYPLASRMGLISQGLSWAGLLALLGLGAAWMRRRPLASLAIFWVFVTLSVESTVFPISDVIFEHRLYLATAGYGLGLSLLLRRLCRYPGVIASSGAAIALVLGGVTYHRAALWSDPVRLLEDAAAKAPGKARTRHLLGAAYRDAGRVREAETEFRKAAALDPDRTGVLIDLGNLYASQERYKEAIALYEKALRRRPSAEALNNLGNIYHLQGKQEKALLYYLRARALGAVKGTDNNIGTIYFEQGKMQEALNAYRRALMRDPYDPQVYYNLAQVYVGLRWNDQAVAAIRRAQVLAPGWPLPGFLLGLVYQQMGRLDEAAAAYKGVLRRDPRFARAHNNLAVVDYERGRRAEALRHARAAEALGYAVAPEFMKLLEAEDDDSGDGHPASDGGGS